MRIEFFEDRNVKETVVTIQAPARSDEIEELMEAIRGFVPHPISGYSDGVLTKIRKNEIIRIYSKDKRVYADTLDSTYLLKSPLYRLEEELPDNFVRISNSEIVNADKIIRMDLNLIGTIRIHMEGNIESFVSRRYVSKVKKVLT
jgi:DNA-binding LytR/AlgR family response regulator